MGWLKNFPVVSTFSLDLVNRGKWLGRTVNIKKANEQAEIYVGRSPVDQAHRLLYVRLVD